MQTEDFSPSQIGDQQDEDVRGHDLLVDRGPVVGVPAVLAHVRPDAGRDVVVDRADDVDLHALFAQDGDGGVAKTLRMRGLG